MYLGDIRLGDTIDFKFTSRTFTTGAPGTLSSSPVISAYPGNSTTELTAGITLTVDFDARTGLNNVRVVATSGNGYATATNYAMVITTGTVGGVSVVGEVVATFSIEARSALMPTTAARTLVVDAAGLADANMVKLGPTGAGTAQTARDIGTSVLLSSGTGTGQLSVAAGIAKVDVDTIKTQALTAAAGITFPTSIASPTNITAGTITTTTNLTNAPTAGDFTATMKTSIGTAVAASAVASVTGNVGGNVTGSVGSVVGAVGSVTGAVGSVTGLTASDVGAIKAKTDNLPSDPADASDIAIATSAIFARLGAPAGASVSADIAAAKVDTAAIKAKTDSLTFTTAGMVDSAIKRVGNTTLNAAGTGGQGYGA